jgi:hypothetical protein
MLFEVPVWPDQNALPFFGQPSGAVDVEIVLTAAVLRACPRGLQAEALRSVPDLR